MGNKNQNKVGENHELVKLKPKYETWKSEEQERKNNYHSKLRNNGIQLHLFQNSRVRSRTGKKRKWKRLKGNSTL